MTRRHKRPHSTIDHEGQRERRKRTRRLPELDVSITPNGLSVKAILAHGARLHNRHKYYLCFRWCTAAIAAYPSVSDFLVCRARASMCYERFEFALQDLNRASDMEGPTPSMDTLLLLAKAHLLCGHIKEASELSQSVLARSIDAPRITARAVPLANQVQQTAAALDACEVAMTAHNWSHACTKLEEATTLCEGGYGPCWDNCRMRLELGRNNLHEALYISKRLLRHSYPVHHRTRILCSMVLVLAGELNEARDQADQLLASYPDFADVQETVDRIQQIQDGQGDGRAALRDGRPEDALAALNLALEGVGNHQAEAGGGFLRGSLLQDRACALLQLQRFVEALQDVETALTSRPKDWELLRTRGRIYMAQDNFQDAQTAFTEAWMREGTGLPDLVSELNSAELGRLTGTPHNYFTILGLPSVRDIPVDDVKAAFKKQSLLCHPDKTGLTDGTKFDLVKKARDMLVDPIRQRQYYDDGSRVFRATRRQA